MVILTDPARPREESTAPPAAGSRADQGVPAAGFLSASGPRPAGNPPRGPQAALMNRKEETPAAQECLGRDAEAVPADQSGDAVWERPFMEIRNE